MTTATIEYLCRFDELGRERIDVMRVLVSVWYSYPEAATIAFRATEDELDRFAVLCEEHENERYAAILVFGYPDDYEEDEVA